MKHGKVQCHWTSGSKCKNICRTDKMIDDMAISLHQVLDEMVETGFRPHHWTSRSESGLKEETLESPKGWRPFLTLQPWPSKVVWPWVCVQRQCRVDWMRDSTVSLLFRIPGHINCRRLHSTGPVLRYFGFLVLAAPALNAISRSSWGEESRW